MTLVVGCSPPRCGSNAESHAQRYDRDSGQAAVTNHAQIDAVLESLTAVSYSELPPSYVKSTEQDGAPFVGHLDHQRYYAVQGTDRFKFLVGSFRIDAFLAHDDKWDSAAGTYRHQQPQYLLLDQRVPHIILDLQRALADADADESAFEVREAFRHPQLNRDGGGASRSRHIYGEAVDLVVGDVDRDGDADEDDKKIIIEILDHDLIGSKGGIGRYPGTDTVHFDVRGRRARWDTY